MTVWNTDLYGTTNHTTTPKTGGKMTKKKLENLLGKDLPLCVIYEGRGYHAYYRVERVRRKNKLFVGYVADHPLAEAIEIPMSQREFNDMEDKALGIFNKIWGKKEKK